MKISPFLKKEDENIQNTKGTGFVGSFQTLTDGQNMKLFGQHHRRGARDAVVPKEGRRIPYPRSIHGPYIQRRKHVLGGGRQAARPVPKTSLFEKEIVCQICAGKTVSHLSAY